VSEYFIAPSVLAADFARLGEEVDAVLTAGADMVHFDVMDNHYVPNLTVGPMVCQALRDFGVRAPIDVHLMVQPVDALIEMFAKREPPTSLFTRTPRIMLIDLFS
jgi:ribulose-phosphate 3-epimerase